MSHTTTSLKPMFPRPALVHDHRRLFQEPAYEGGQPYAADDDEGDEQPLAITR